MRAALSLFLVGLILLGPAFAQQSRSFSFSTGDDQEGGGGGYYSASRDGESEGYEGGSSYSYGGGQRTRQGRPIVIRREVEQTVIPQEEEEQSGYGGEGEWAQRRGGQEEEGYGQWQYPEMQQQSPDELDEGPRRPISPQERNLRFFYHPQDCFPFHDQFPGRNMARLQRGQPQMQQSPPQSINCPACRMLNLQPQMRCLPPPMPMPNFQQQQPSLRQQQCRMSLYMNKLYPCAVGPRAQFGYPPRFVQCCLPSAEEQRQMFMNRLPQRQRRMMPMRPIRQPAMMPGSYQLDEPYQGDQCFPPINRFGIPEYPQQFEEQPKQQDDYYYDQEQMEQEPTEPEQPYDEGQTQEYDQYEQEQPADEQEQPTYEEQQPADESASEQGAAEESEQPSSRAQALAYLRREPSYYYYY